MEDNTFRQFVDEVKDKVDLVSVIEGSGAEFALVKRGRYATGSGHSSLVVDTETGLYHWNSRGEKGDVFEWIQKRHGGEFWEIVKEQARKVGVRVPETATAVTPASLAFRAQVELFDLVARVLAERLQKVAPATDYVWGRGWSEETVRLARLGFADPKGKGELLGEMKLYGLDPQSPAAVAVLGFEGDVKGWAKAHNVEPQSNWVEKGRIWGVMDFPRLVYPHVERGKVTYFSARNLKWDGLPGEGRLIGDSERKSHNLPVALVGARRVLFNQEYTRGGE